MRVFAQVLPDRADVFAHTSDSRTDDGLPMLPTIARAAALLSAVGFWLKQRRDARHAQHADARHAQHADGAARTAEKGSLLAAEGARVNEESSAPAADIAAVNTSLTERLWSLAFASADIEERSHSSDLDVRDTVSALLSADELDRTLLPRRPALMPQLMQVMDDPRAATERLSRIVAHDPVLAADVLKLANSSRFRATAQPIETLQRAIVVMGADALRGLLAVAMMQPVFRASRSNFPRFPRLLWERTERAARAAEAYTLRVNAEDRFEAQLAILLSALGPLMVYGATLDVYRRHPALTPNPALCARLAGAWGGRMALRIAAHWETSPRMAAAIERRCTEPLARALGVGELLGTLSLLRSMHVVEQAEALEVVNALGLDCDLLESASPRAA